MLDQWCQNFFTTGYADSFLKRSKSDREEVVDFLQKNTGIKKGDSVYDQCCGTGDISFELADRGMKVVGVDQSPEYIKRACDAAKKQGLKIDFKEGNAYKFSTESKVDAVINWYTSFGYGPDDETNKKMIQRAYESLKPGGRFVIDFYSLPLIIANFEREHHYNLEHADGVVEVEKISGMNLGQGEMVSTWHYTFANGDKESFSGKTKSYMPIDLARMCRECGFKEMKFFGDVNSSSLTLKSPRCILIAQK